MKQSIAMHLRYARFGLYLFFAIAALAMPATDVGAYSTYFSANCAGCHVGQTGSNFCGMCHAHGVHATSGKTDFNVAGTLNKTTPYAPGEMVSVTISGGYRPSQARAVLYDNNGVQLAVSTGTPSSGSGPVNAPVWPVTLSAPAPAAGGTYTWKIAWYGNQFDTGTYGPGWKADTTNPGHGWEIVSLLPFTVSAPGDTTPPSVASTAPVNNATAVPVSTTVAAVFGEPMKASTVTTATFLLMQGTTPVPGTVTLSGTTATFRPSAALAANTVYTATITTAVQDAAGNPMAASYAWSFTTAPAADTTPPTVLSVSPLAGATGVAVNAAVTAVFSEAVDPQTVTAATFTLRNGATAVSGTVSTAGGTATFRPAAALANGTTYTATLTTGIRDLAGNALGAGTSWTFTTGAAADTTPPTVTGTSPGRDATGVPATTAVTATFSENLDASTVTTASFTVKNGANVPVVGAVTYVGATATFAPASPLAGNTTYMATLTTGIRDLAGNALAQPYTWSFTTAAQTSDRDGDGAVDSEDEYPDDDRIATVRATKGNGKIKVDVSANPGAYLRAVAAKIDSDPSFNQSGKPAGKEFRNGMVGYEVRGIAAGSTVRVRITFPDAIPSGSKVYQVDSSGFREISGADIEGNTVTLTLTDGGVGDTDRTRNGVIVDPVGVAAPVVEPSAAGGGCSMTGTGGDPRDLAGTFGALLLAALGFALRGRRKGKEASWHGV